MKALSLWEPWASLIRTKAKTYETRSWSTRYRGPLLICAAKGGLSKGELIGTLSSWNFQGGLAPLIGKSLDLSARMWAGVNLNDLNFGKAVAIVELVDCIPTENITLGEIFGQETFGDYGPRRFAWKLRIIEVSFEPFPVLGGQGLFMVDDAIIKKNVASWPLQAA